MYPQNPQYGQSQPQYTPPPNAAGYPGYPAQQHPGYYMTPEQQFQQPTAPPPPAGTSRKLIVIMGSVCAVLLLLVTGSAYFFFFSGTAPTVVVEEYIGHVQEDDLAAARDMTTTDAEEGVKWIGEADEIEALRQWFSKETLDWTVREESTSAKYSTVTVDKSMDLDGYDKPIESRWDYRLERESGSWRIDAAKLIVKVPDGAAGPGDCVLQTGLQYEASECAVGDLDSQGQQLFKVNDEVSRPEDCPDPKAVALESGDDILCLDETEPAY